MRRGSVCRVVFHQAHWDYLVLKGSGLTSSEAERGWTGESKHSDRLSSSLWIRLAALPQPATDPSPRTDPVTCRHPAWRPLMCCLLFCTVGVRHTPWESNVEFHTMGPLAGVVWGLREGLGIKRQPVCEANSGEQYFTHSTFGQRMLMSVDSLSLSLDLILSLGWTAGACQDCVNSVCSHLLFTFDL